MKIGVDAQCLIGKRTGVGNYTAHMMDALQGIDTNNYYYLALFQFFTKKFRPPLELQNKNFSYNIIRMLPGRVFSKLLKLNLLPPLDLFLGKKVYLFPNFVSWPLLSSKSVVIIYDLSYVLHGQYSQEANRKFLTRFVPKSIKRASAIITISQNSKKEITRYYRVDPEKITVANPAIDHEFFRPRKSKKIAEVRKKYNLPGKYILYVGTLEPRKNITGIVEAYNLLPKNIKNEYALVLGGGKGWKDTEIGTKIENLRSSGERIHATGYLNQGDLPALYSGASLFVFPSFYEGWGMPPLEAMACGVPVITANNSSLPEVVGNAAILVDATDTGALAQSMQKVLTDPVLAKRMVIMGLKQAKMFSWEKSASKILEVLERVDRG